MSVYPSPAVESDSGISEGSKTPRRKIWKRRSSSEKGVGRDPSADLWVTCAVDLTLSVSLSYEGTGKMLTPWSGVMFKLLRDTIKGKVVISDSCLKRIGWWIGHQVSCNLRSCNVVQKEHQTYSPEQKIINLESAQSQNPRLLVKGKCIKTKGHQTVPLAQSYHVSGSPGFFLRFSGKLRTYQVTDEHEKLFKDFKVVPLLDSEQLAEMKVELDFLEKTMTAVDFPLSEETPTSWEDDP